VKRWLKTLGMAGAVLFLVLTVVNASWLAPEPKGAAKIIAHRGISQQYDKTGLGRDDCTATRIEQPVHDYLENTTRSIARTAKLGATLVEVDIAPTSDGEMAVFHDWTVDCRTQASGDTRDFALEELKALDAGYGYTADGGESFPFRDEGVGAIPSLEEAMQASGRAQLLYTFKSKDSSEADLLAAKIKAAIATPARAAMPFMARKVRWTASARISPMLGPSRWKRASNARATTCCSAGAAMCPRTAGTAPPSCRWIINGRSGVGPTA